MLVPVIFTISVQLESFVSRYLTDIFFFYLSSQRSRVSYLYRFNSCSSSSSLPGGLTLSVLIFYAPQVILFRILSLLAVANLSPPVQPATTDVRGACSSSQQAIIYHPAPSLFGTGHTIREFPCTAIHFR